MRIGARANQAEVSSGKVKQNSKSESKTALQRLPRLPVPPHQFPRLSAARAPADDEFPASVTSSGPDAQVPVLAELVTKSPQGPRRLGLTERQPTTQFSNWNDESGW